MLVKWKFLIRYRKLDGKLQFKHFSYKKKIVFFMLKAIFNSGHF